MKTRIVVLVCDGLRPDRIDPVRTPALARLRAEGVAYPNSRTVFPSETRVAAASLVTGCLPGEHGLLANDFYDPVVFAQRAIATASADDLAELERIRGRLLQRMTLAERLTAAGLRYAAVSTASQGTSRILAAGARAPHGFVWSPHPGIATPDAADAVEAAIGPSPAHAIPRVAAIDHAARVMTDYVLPRFDPDVAIFWSGEPDTTYHYRGIGSADAARAERAADDALARLLDWRARAGETERTQIIVVSDHGHVTGMERIDIATLLRDGGWPVAEGTPGADDLVVVPGSVSFVHGLAEGSRRAHEFLAWLGDQDWFGAAFARRSMAGRATLTQLGLSNRAAPDLAFTLRQDDGIAPDGTVGRCLYDATLPVGAGMHGGLHALEMTNVLMMHGARFRSGVTIGMHAGILDLVPTILDLLGIPADGAQGRRLREAYAPTRDAIRDGNLDDVTRHELLLPEASSGLLVLRRSHVGTASYIDGLAST
jgi:arylsulfatase A-like enzyme